MSEPTHQHAPGPKPSAHVDYANTWMCAALKTWPTPAIRGLFPYELVPDMVSFLAGKPNPSAFPVRGMAVEATNPHAGKVEKLQVVLEDLQSSLQYGTSAGLPALVKTLHGYQSKIHAKPDFDLTNPGVHTPWATMTGNGSQDLICKAMMVLTDKDDTVLIEAPTFPEATSASALLGNRLFSIPTDERGLVPSALRTALAQWHTHPKSKALRYPKVLYTIPTGGNPSGATADEDRKRDILAITREFRILILEDDPYYFLSFDGLGQDPATRPRPRSYLALEQEGVETWGDGRVLRFDSFSKIMAAGMRIGVATGPAPLIKAMESMTATYQLQPSYTAQAVVQTILAHWGFDTFLAHCDKVAHFYLQRRDFFEAALTKVLGSGVDGKQTPVASWVRPTAGMFYFVKLRLPPVPGSPNGDSQQLVEQVARAKGVLAVPGYAFTPGVDEPSACVRVSFSIVPLDQVETGLHRLRESVLEAWAEARMPLGVGDTQKDTHSTFVAAASPRSAL